MGDGVGGRDGEVGEGVKRGDWAGWREGGGGEGDG